VDFIAAIICATIPATTSFANSPLQETHVGSKRDGLKRLTEIIVLEYALSAF
jgi:hypothetical protein